MDAPVAVADFSVSGCVNDGPCHVGPIPDDALTLTLDQVAKLLQVSRRTLERWDSISRIPGRIALPGRLVRYSRSAIQRWLADGCPEPRRSSAR